MRTDTTILAQLDRQFQWMHAYRRRLLCELTLTLVRKGRGWLTALGRDLDSSTCAKHRIKRVDRFVGNPRLHAELPRIYQSLCQTLVVTPRPVILIDWTELTHTHCALVASIPCKGRAQIIYQQVHLKRYVSNRSVQRRFLLALSKVVPPGCTPIVIADAGFMGPWFSQIRKLGWDFVGRLPSNVRLQKADKTECKVAQLHPRRCERPKHLGLCTVTKLHPYTASVVVVRQRNKGIAHRRASRAGAGHNSILHYRYKRRAHTAWVLVTSLHERSAPDIVALYESRMQCEESFRDAKNLKLGLGLSHARSRHPERLQVLCLLAALAAFVATALGLIAYQHQIHPQLQANTVKHRRVFSLPRLGAMAFRLRLLPSISARAWAQALRRFPIAFSSA
jgi:hypothetical protein